MYGVSASCLPLLLICLVIVSDIPDKTVQCTDVSKDKDVKEPEPARNDLAFSERFLRSVFAVLRQILDARGGAVVVMIEFKQRSQVS